MHRAREVLTALLAIACISAAVWFLIDRLGDDSSTVAEGSASNETTEPLPSPEPTLDEDMLALRERALAFQEAWLTPGLAAQHEAIRPYVSDEFLAQRAFDPADTPTHLLESDIVREFDPSSGQVTVVEFFDDTNALLTVCVPYVDTIDMREQDTDEPDLRRFSTPCVPNEVYMSLVDNEWIVVATA